MNKTLGKIICKIIGHSDIVDIDVKFNKNEKDQRCRLKCSRCGKYISDWTPSFGFEM